MRIQPATGKQLEHALRIVIVALLTAGCSNYYYNPAPPILPAYIHKLAIRPFANHTQQLGLEDKLTLAIQSRFDRNGRYEMTTEAQADGVVIGDITQYILEPLAFDADSTPNRYKLWIIVNVTFYDKVKDQTLWVEPNLGNPVRYWAASSGRPGALTEIEAQQRIWNRLARDILRRTLGGFGTVTGMSDKAVPKSSPEQYNPSVSPPPPGPGFSSPPPSIPIH